MKIFSRNLKVNRLDIALIFLLFVLISMGQFFLARKHLEFGFFIDDWIFLSQFRQIVENPLLDVVKAWKELRSHTFAHAYYIAILHDFFGLNYSYYHILNQLLKILATLSVYPLVVILFRNRLVAFLTTLIFGIHFSPFGTLDNASRGEDFIAIIFMNILFIIYILLIRKKITNYKYMMPTALLFFATMFIDPTRMFPLIVIMPLIELAFLFWNKKEYSVKFALQRLGYLYLPLALLFLISPEAIITQLLYVDGLYKKLVTGNSQLVLAPFASFGSMFIPREIWPLFKIPSPQDLSTFLNYFLKNLLVIFSLINLVIGFLVFKSTKWSFILRTTLLNLAFGLIAFFLGSNWYVLNTLTRAAVDPGVFFLPSIIGFYILSLSISILYEIRNNKERFLIFGLFGSVIFSLIFIVLTWIWADVNSIFMGVHAYLNIPSIGASLFAAIILSLIIQKRKRSGIVISLFFICLLFIASFVESNKYFSFWLENGLKASDQERFLNTFWDEVGYSRHFGNDDFPNNVPLFYLDLSEDYPNGNFYDHVIVYKILNWIVFRPGEGWDARLAFCDTIILDKKDLLTSVKVIDGKKVLFRDKCDRAIQYNTNNFYAFKLKDRNITPITKQVLQELGIEQ